MERIVFLDRETVRAEIKKPAFPHEWREYPHTAPHEVAARLRAATIAITNKAPVRAEALAAAPDLRLIAVAATGVDCVDLDRCRERGVVVCNVTHYANDSVPEHVMMLTLALRRNLPAYRAAVAAGEWGRATSFALLDYPLRDVRGAALGIVGYGTLGRAVERLALALGMRVLVAEHKGAARVRENRVEFAEVLRQSDVVTLHCPLTDETRNLIGAAELALMSAEAILINCARGGVVDEAALVEALRGGRLGGAGVDVLTKEPPRGGHPLLEAAQSLSNLIVTPHVAWASEGAVRALADQVVDNLEAFIGGSPQNRVV